MIHQNIVYQYWHLSVPVMETQSKDNKKCKIMQNWYKKFYIKTLIILNCLEDNNIQVCNLSTEYTQCFTKKEDIGLITVISLFYDTAKYKN